MRPLFDWLDDRTGYRGLLAPIRRRVLPDGPSWWLTSASCLAWIFAIEVVTGLLLMTTYSPSITSAWASAFYIDQSAAGRFLRGLHYFASHALIVLLAVHVVRVLACQAFKAPRELIWITGLFLMPVVIAWAVTGNPLCASQKAVAQIEVEANIIGSTPLVGGALERLFLGGDDVGQLTFTHLYFLHVGLLPLVGLALLAVHLSQVYRQSLADKGTADIHDAVPYWPYQSARNATVVGVVVAVTGWLAWRHGAPLDAPADSEIAVLPRPEWYFRWLFELRRYFTGESEFIATLVVPLAILMLFLAIPFMNQACGRKTGTAMRWLVTITGMAACIWLTWVSLARDSADPEYLAAQIAADALAERSRLLADRNGVPPEGASALLRNDPQTQGPLIFQRHCASCHSYADPTGTTIVTDEASAPDLYRFGSTRWIAGLLDAGTITGPQYFGHTRFADGDMVGAVGELHSEPSEELASQLHAVAVALSAERAMTTDTAADVVAEGKDLIAGDLGCTNCHKFHDEGELGSAPDLTGYASRQWLEDFIRNPRDERFYGDRNDRMPAFADRSLPANQQLLSERELRLLVDWLSSN